MVDRGHRDLGPPHHTAAPHDSASSSPDGESKSNAAASGEVEFVEVDPEADEAEDDRVAVQTRIDVIRMKDYRGAGDETASGHVDDSDSQQPMDEALNYLLRQLRDSQQRKAA
jgi:hypothetical protein